MLLSLPQKYLLSLLNSFGALRDNQAAKLLHMNNEFAKLEPTVYPLVCRGEVIRDNGYIIARGGTFSHDAIAAIDVMLLLEGKNIDTIQTGVKPFDLTFFKLKKDKLCRYDICVVTPGREAVIVAALEGIFTKHRTIVFVLKDLSQRELLYAPCDYCFAIKENDKYHFFKAERRNNL